ncbi:MAG: RsmB/NOP family class I SAM-dependent RNA methyltransferase [Candidatus Nanoarchaeia archaeon]|nr:RsmB/NOP family class I SAM-dependent RNA methyltransferase [Candidatus Nanoarchaeia archaeon]MDD5357937.1 RsmB/NOP family class I SAM-dependent RNA methyltransferase [Candidatus Nanoarchaeia archaeon]MDD5588856.1 RsmB/NOP family class I SAM-dependent RNA methyltransferase [Candidatus Nanoarchaeia archaeon]
MTKRTYEPKPLFLERMKILLGKDFESYMEILKEEPVRSFRCNTLKISPKELKKRLEEKGWKIKIPFKDFPEIMIVESKLQPGELGRALEHLLGYYYIQEIASMLPPLVLNPKPGEKVLDLCASPGSKTTQMSAMMKNSGLLIANEMKIGRIKILAANTERCGVMNMIITKKDGIALCNRFKNEKFFFDKILLDAPCSGEGTIRSTPSTLEMWNIKTIENLSRLQKSLIASAIEILKPNGELVYSTCTHAPEENEEVIDFALKNFNVKVEKINLPIKTNQGIVKFGEKEYLEDVKLTCRVYPQTENTEGFFIAKIKKLK